MLYPTELRAQRPRLRTYGAFARSGTKHGQPFNGTNRKTAAHYGTVVSQSAAQSKSPRSVAGTEGGNANWSSAVKDHYITSDRQVHHTKQRLTKDPRYTGRCDSFSDDEVKAMILEGCRYFGLAEEPDFPPPPLGLVGTSKSFDSRVEPLVEDGFKYFLGLIKGEARAQYNVYERIAQTLQTIHNKGLQLAEVQHTERVFNNAQSMEEYKKFRNNQLVYFIGSATGPIKIGIAIDPEARLKGLQTASPEKLYILTTCSGGLKQEQAYHNRFSKHRLEGEWFERHPDILAEINRLNAPTPSPTGEN